MNNLVLSVESGSNRVLKEIMHKPLDLSIVKRVIADCRELGIASDISILIGLPGETKQDIEDARTFLKTLYSIRLKPLVSASEIIINSVCQIR